MALLRARGPLRVNYDREGPLTQLDYGGPDQEKKYAFVITRTTKLAHISGVKAGGVCIEESR